VLAARIVLPIVSLVGVQAAVVVTAAVEIQSPAGKLTRPQAAALLSKERAFIEPQIIQVNQDKECIMMEPGSSTHPRYSDLMTLDTNKIATFRTLGPNDATSDSDFFSGMMKCPAPRGRWIQVTLTPEAKAVAGKWRRGTTYFIPVQSRKFLQVTGISFRTPTIAQVDYDWAWQNITSFAPRKADSSVPSPATATLQLYDDGWRVVTLGVR
jgi:hypothetical protein